MKDKYPALTIQTLAALCAEEIKRGNGNKKILISCDDEGNGFHGLFYSFITDEETIRDYQNYGLFHDNVDYKTVALLG